MAPSNFQVIFPTSLNKFLEISGKWQLASLLWYNIALFKQCDEFHLKLHEFWGLDNL